MMSKHLVFIRHGRSDGNDASMLLRENRYDEIPKGLFGLPGWKWRLTPEGERQCLAARAWIVENLGENFFTKGFASSYVRARETVGLLDLSIDWKLNLFVREREYGELDCLPTKDQLEAYYREMQKKRENRLFWIPPSGESFADLAHRADRLYDTLHRECSQDRVLVVTHGDTIGAHRILLERLLPEEFEKRETDPDYDIHNCGILHYTRQNPFDPDDVRENLDWVRYINPCEPPTDPRAAWKGVVRRKYSSRELLEQATSYPRFF